MLHCTVACRSIGYFSAVLCCVACFHVLLCTSVAQLCVLLLIVSRWLSASGQPNWLLTEFYDHLPRRGHGMSGLESGEEDVFTFHGGVQQLTCDRKLKCSCLSMPKAPQHRTLLRHAHPCMDIHSVASVPSCFEKFRVACPRQGVLDGRTQATK